MSAQPHQASLHCCINQHQQNSFWRCYGLASILQYGQCLSYSQGSQRPPVLLRLTSVTELWRFNAAYHVAADGQGLSDGISVISCSDFGGRCPALPCWWQGQSMREIRPGFEFRTTVCASAAPPKRLQRAACQSLHIFQFPHSGARRHMLLVGCGIRIIKITERWLTQSRAIARNWASRHSQHFASTVTRIL
jgi:hypothetical protein